MVPQQASPKEDPFIPSPLVRQEAEAPTPKVTAEQVALYISKVDPCLMVSLPIADHQEKDEAAHIREIPTDRAQVESIGTSLFKVAYSAELLKLKKYCFSTNNSPAQ